MDSVHEGRTASDLEKEIFLARVQVQCFSCQTQLDFEDKVGFRSECSQCMADVHVCKNCEFYDPKVYNECRETSADVIREKERSNYCEFFKPRPLAGAKETTSKDDLKAAAEALFRKR